MTQITEFRNPQMEDVDLLRDIFMKNYHMACDYSSANIILWSEVYKTQIAYVDNILFVKFDRDGKDYFLFPCVNNEDGEVQDERNDMKTEKIQKGLRLLENYCESKNDRLRFGVLEPSDYEKLEQFYPGVYHVEYMRDSADYVYEVDKLATLSGKAYHGKKNHVNKFRKTYEDWSYEALSKQNQQEAIEMVEAWCEENHCCEDMSKVAELCVCINGIRNFETLGLIGGVLRVNDKVVAITLGEPLNKDTFVVHFEKALQEVPGSYTMINQQFVQNEMQAYKYVNREEDLGLEGLRKAKESYKPVFMAEKGIAVKGL